MLIGLLWMVYDLINAPEVDEDENFLYPDSEEEEEDLEEEDTPKPDTNELPERKKTKVN